MRISGINVENIEIKTTDKANDLTTSMYGSEIPLQCCIEVFDKFEKTSDIPSHSQWPIQMHSNSQTVPLCVGVDGPRFGSYHKNKIGLEWDWFQFINVLDNFTANNKLIHSEFIHSCNIN